MTSPSFFSSRPLRIGTVPYLNAWPLVANFSRFFPRSEIISEVPAKLELLLNEGSIDVAILSSAYLLGHPETQFVPGVSIASLNRVGSVLLYRRKPLPALQHVALDPDSLTSNTLLRILLEQDLKLNPEYTRAEGSVLELLNTHDAVLRIGMLVETLHSEVQVDDLGWYWHLATGLPFVYALWMIRPGITLTADEVAAFVQLKNFNLSHLDELLTGTDYVERWGFEACRKYLTDCVIYELGSPFQEGLHLYLERARALENQNVLTR